MNRFRRTAISCYMIMSMAIGMGCGGDEHGSASNTQQGIIGGSLYTGLPAIGALTYYGTFYCTGTLIAPRKVLTAAHCLDGVAINYIKFVTGADIKYPQHKYRAAAINIHPDYYEDDYTIENDIAVLELAEDATEQPMEVVTKMDSSWVGTKLFVVGYGVTNGWYYTTWGQKRSVWIPVATVESTTFSYGDDTVNTCFGDSGGPALYQKPDGSFQIAGVTSYGEDAYCKTPTHDFRVDQYLAFLGISSSGDCNGETARGRCDGATLINCQANGITKTDCKASGKVCSYDQTTDTSLCSEPTSNSCKGESSMGRCSNGWLIWCGTGYQVMSENCTAEGKTCQLGYYDYYECL